MNLSKLKIEFEQSISIFSKIFRPFKNAELTAFLFIILLSLLSFSDFGSFFFFFILFF